MSQNTSDQCTTTHPAVIEALCRLFLGRRQPCRHRRVFRLLPGRLHRQRFQVERYRGGRGALRVPTGRFRAFSGEAGARRRGRRPQAVHNQRRDRRGRLYRQRPQAKDSFVFSSQRSGEESVRLHSRTREIRIPLRRRLRTRGRSRASSPMCIGR